MGCRGNRGCCLAQAPEFVRKHILNKHGEKVAAVRQEVEFFNNYLLDAKRPSPPENKPLPPPGPGEKRADAWRGVDAFNSSTCCCF